MQHIICRNGDLGVLYDMLKWSNLTTLICTKSVHILFHFYCANFRRFIVQIWGVSRTVCGQMAEIQLIILIVIMSIFYSRFRNMGIILFYLPMFMQHGLSICTKNNVRNSLHLSPVYFYKNWTKKNAVVCGIRHLRQSTYHIKMA